MKERAIAFTLAEVLITLGIIGVVAAITMPTLITKHEKQVTVTQLKKAYSELSQALQRAEADNDPMETWNFGYLESDLQRTMHFGENYIFPYIKTVKKCIPSNEECWREKIKDINGTEFSTNYYTNNFTGSFVTASGYSVYYWLHSVGTGMDVIVDINGHKKGPNKLGKDIFSFVGSYAEKKFKPFGYQYKRDDLINGTTVPAFVYHACKKAEGSHGGSCASVIMQDGWQIKDDYPW